MRRLLLFSILISFNSFGEWKFHSSSLRGDTFHLHADTITKDERYVYYWYLKSYLIPNKYGDFSAKVKVKGDCSNNKLKYLTYVWYKEPMGKGLGERSDKASEWEYPTAASVGAEMLIEVCKS
tara:strand:- start:1994 stop:2362 length:369 start_codon:yes stop_codon:yes gene_type:complete